MLKKSWWLLSLSFLVILLAGCSESPTLNQSEPSGPNPEPRAKGEVSIDLGVDRSGDFVVSGEYAYPIKAIKNIGGIYWVAGFETALREARDTENYLYILWEDESDQVVVHTYDIGQQFDVRFSRTDWVRKLSHSGDGNLVVFVEKQVLVTETYGSSSSSCPGAPPQRIVVGERASVCTKSDRVRVRESPGVFGEELTRLEPGTTFRVVKGPRCADNWSWWRIRTSDGIVGWVAEGGDEKDPYFICPK
jgi:hypothetical protein